MHGLWLHACERHCSWRLCASTSSMRDERCCRYSRRGTCTPICSVSSTDRARILAGCLICCSICAGHTRSQTWRSTSLFFASPPSAESALAAVLSLCHAVSCLAVCVLLCRLLPVPTSTLTCTASTQPSLRYNHPWNKGAEGAVTVRERAVNEAALCVSSRVSCGVFVWLCSPWCSAPASPAASLSPPPFSVPICAHGGFQGPLRGGPMPRQP